MIGIIDYKAGNAPSALNACRRLGVDARLLSAPDEIEECGGIILPGVGSAQATMDSLRETGIADALKKKVLDGGAPFLGICIGLQVLFEHSEEEDAECLGWLSGEVRRFPEQMVRVPQIGWNEVRFVRERPVLSGIGESGFFAAGEPRGQPQGAWENGRTAGQQVDNELPDAPGVKNSKKFHRREGNIFVKRK